MKQALARVCAVAILGLSVAYLGLAVWFHLRVPEPSDWEQAAQVVMSHYTEGDCVVFHPAWAQEGAPLFDGMDVVTAETIDWYEVGKRKRVWVVASRRLNEARLPAGFEQDGVWNAGSMEVGLYRNVRHEKLVYDFLEQIGVAKVTRVYRDRREECSLFRQGRWHCGSEHPWQFVGVHWKDIAGAVRRVIWAHPLNGNNPIEIRYPSVELASILVLHYGWTQRAVEAGLGEPVTFTVWVGSTKVFEKILRLEDTEWHEERLDLSSLKGRREDVLFVVSTPNYQNRQFCFTADLWETL